MELPILYDSVSPSVRRKVREEYVRLQNNLCMFCDQSLDGPPHSHVTDKPINLKLFPPNFLKYPIHLQHCHKTGLTEGAVHAYCNAVLWQYYNR